MPKCLENILVKIIYINSCRYVPGCESLLVLDDMRYQGYSLVSSLSPSKLSSSSDIILESLALLHTAGLILKHKNQAQSLTSLYPFLMDINVYIQWRSQLFKEKLIFLQGRYRYFKSQYNSTKTDSFYASKKSESF